MKAFIALLLLCIAHESYQEQTCDDEEWGRELWGCYQNNGVGNFVSGKGINNLGDLCRTGQIGRLSSCMLKVTDMCYAEWYDRKKIADAENNLCKTPQIYDSPECHVSTLGILSGCTHEMSEKFERKKNLYGNQTIVYCHLYGGIKKCMYEHWRKCSAIDHYKALLETFTPTGCAAFWDCGFCEKGEMPAGSSSIVTTSVAAVVGAIFLYKLL